MSTSGSTDYNLTASGIIDAAFNVLGVAQEGEALTARMLSDGMRALNLMIKTWGAYENLWVKTEGTLAPVAGQASYSLTTPRPMRMLSVRRVLSGNETPLNMMAREQYFDQPNKTANPAIPVSYYFDPQQASGVLYLWPAPSTTFVAAQTMTLTYMRRMADMDASNNDLDMPQEWLETVVWNLAKRLMTQYPVNDPNLAMMIRNDADEMKAALMAFDHEPASLFLQADTCHA